MSDTPLSREQVIGLLSNTRNRGGAEATIRAFNESGELYVDLMEQPEWSEKKIDSLYNSFTQNVKKLGEDFSHIKVLRTEVEGRATVLLIDKALAFATESDEVETEEVEDIEDAA